MTVVFLFPGQGSQAVGMGRAFAEVSAAAKAVFVEANDTLGFELAPPAYHTVELAVADAFGQD